MTWGSITGLLVAAAVIALPFAWIASLPARRQGQ